MVSMLPCVPMPARRCGEWFWASSTRLILFKLPTGITEDMGLWSSSGGRWCFPTGLPIPPALIPHRQLKSCMVSPSNLFSEASLGSWAGCPCLQGLLRVCSKSLPGLSSSLSLFSCPISAYLKIHGFHESHSFLSYLTDYVHSFTDTL